LDELNTEPRARAQVAGAAKKAEGVTVITGKDGFLEVLILLLEQKEKKRSAVKAPPAQTVLDGAVDVTQNAAEAHKNLNEMQRSRGGDMVEEDVSRYLVTLRKAGAPEDWSGEVIGFPALFPLQTVSVLAANKMIFVFDKSNKKLWQSQLNYNVSSVSRE